MPHLTRSGAVFRLVPLPPRLRSITGGTLHDRRYGRLRDHRVGVRQTLQHRLRLAETFPAVAGEDSPTLGWIRTHHLDMPVIRTEATASSAQKLRNAVRDDGRPAHGIEVRLTMSHWIWIAVLVLDIIAIVSVVAGHGSLGHKVLWTILILVLPVIGMILYYVVGRSAADAG